MAELPYWLQGLEAALFWTALMLMGVLLPIGITALLDNGPGHCGGEGGGHAEQTAGAPVEHAAPRAAGD